MAHSKNTKELKYYSYDKILAKNCKYSIIFGERSNGKTFGALKIALENFIKSGYVEQSAYIRRFEEDYKGKRGQSLYDGVIASGVLKALNTEWTGVKYFSSRWYLTRQTFDGRTIVMDKPFMFGFALNTMEHDKSSSYPNITMVVFDEFITRQYYLNDEFVLFMNVLSTIIRQRDNVKIFMLGNTVNKYCPYFKEMGLKHISEMEPGDLDCYTYSDSKLTVAVEYSTMGDRKQTKSSNPYFAFDNPKLQMITGGAWELDIYPHLPHKYTPKDIIFTYFLEFEEALLQCEIISLTTDDGMPICFTYIHEKTTPIKNKTDVVFSPKYSPLPNHYRDIRRPVDNLSTKISSFFRCDQVFFQDNEVGEIVRNYLIWCKNSKIGD